MMVSCLLIIIAKMEIDDAAYEFILAIILYSAANGYCTGECTLS